MAAWVSHPFAAPQEKLPIRHGAPPLRRPGKHDGPMLAAEATEVVEEYLAAQTAMTEARKADLQHLADRDVLVVGGTGSGIGGAISLALLNLGSPRTLTVISRDLRQSKEFTWASWWPDWPTTCISGTDSGGLTKGSPAMGRDSTLY